MKKPWLVRLCGWLCLALMGSVFISAAVGGFTYPHQPLFSVAWAAVLIVLSLPCLVVWLIGTTIHSIQKRQANLIGERLERAALQARAEGAPTFPGFWPTPATGERVNTQPLAPGAPSHRPAQSAPPAPAPNHVVVDCSKNKIL